MAAKGDKDGDGEGSRRLGGTYPKLLAREAVVGLSQECSKIIIVIVDSCCHRHVVGETEALHYRVSFSCS